MSRIGKQPVEIPAQVQVNIDEDIITIAGPKGELTRQLGDIVDVRIDTDQILVERRDDSRISRSHQGLVRSLLANMVEGVHTGYTRILDINGVGYRVEQLGPFLRFDLGYSHPIMFELPEGVSAAIERQTILTLTSANKEVVGQAAAKIRGLRPPEPYKGKGIKYREEVIRRKQGKAGGR